MDLRRRHVLGALCAGVAMTAGCSLPRGSDGGTSTPLPSWDRDACRGAGRDRISEVVQARLDAETEPISILYSLDDQAFTVRLITGLNQDGEVKTSPSVTVETVADLTPRTAEITHVSDAGSYVRPVPVRVREVVIREE